jgi:hypothetical protein
MMSSSSYFTSVKHNDIVFVDNFTLRLVAAAIVASPGSPFKIHTHRLGFAFLLQTVTKRLLRL